jgi:hypothetical protein
MSAAQNILEHNTGHQRRREHRWMGGGNALVHVVNSHDPDLIGLRFTTPVMDLSIHGARIYADKMLDDAELDLIIELKESDERLFLMSEVRWMSFEEDGDFHLGLEFIDNATSAITAMLPIPTCPLETTFSESSHLTTAAYGTNRAPG